MPMLGDDAAAVVEDTTDLWCHWPDPAQATAAGA